jgi:hypothetical protein
MLALIRRMIPSIELQCFELLFYCRQNFPALFAAVASLNLVVNDSTVYMYVHVN